jgi:uncharacterized protein (DUF2336 family)
LYIFVYTPFVREQEMLPLNFISDLENAIAIRSTETGAMLHQITDLFLINAGRYSADQLGLYDDVLQTLIAKVDVAARATLAKRLAPVDGAPTAAIRTLALDDAIDVSEPILAQSKALSDDTLIDCIAKGGQSHLLAIATRNKVSEKVSDQLIIKGDKKVLGAIVTNPGAVISDPSFGMLVDKSVGDDWLSECIASRTDIPVRHFRELVTRASDIVRQRLMKNAPDHCNLIADILPSSTPSAVSSTQKDYRTAEIVVKSRPLTEAVVNEFAAAKKLEEVFVSLAQLSGLSPAEIERMFNGEWSGPVAIVLKAIGFHLATLQAIYVARLSDGEAVRADLTRTKAEFIAVSQSTAQRIMRFYSVRKSA